MVGPRKAGWGGAMPELPEGSSSSGRAPVSKTGGWGFESLLPCHPCVRGFAFERYAEQ
jgi:hypothetical protein